MNEEGLPGGRLLAGRYELGEALGAGGMARVVAAWDVLLDRRVAVKLLPVATVDPTGRERFGRETRSSAGFTHPNAVAIHDAGEADGYLYLVMELVDGPSLAARLAEQGALDIDEAVTITDDVLAALGAAHAAGIVHRDVKPGNILLGASGTTKLADFGIAKRLDDLSGDLTGTGQFIGTPKYLAPEQVAGEPATAATDLYATGVVLYEMLAGEPPFDAGTPVATAIAHRDAPVPDIRAPRPDVPVALAAVVGRAMAKDPTQRFPSAAVMQRALHGEVAVSADGGLTAPPSVTTCGVPAAAAPCRGGCSPPPGYSPSPWQPSPLVGETSVPGREHPTPPRHRHRRRPLSVRSPRPACRSRWRRAAPPTATAAPTTTAQPPTSTSPAPASVNELIAVVEGDPDRFGARAGELADELAKVAEANGPKQAERAEDLLGKIEEWVADGELVAGAVPMITAVLEPVAAGPGNSGNAGDEDNGRGGG